MKRRPHIRKGKQFTRAMWYLARGYSHNFIASKTGVHRNTLTKWATRYGGLEDRRSIQRLARQIAQLPPHQAEKLIALARARVVDESDEPSMALAS